MGRMRGKDELKAIHAKGSSNQPSLSSATAFNVKTKRMEKINDPRVVTLKNQKKAITGTGSDGTKLFRIIKG